MKQTLLVLLASVLVCCGTVLAEDLTCLPESERESAALYGHLQQAAYAALDRRLESYERLETPEQIRQYQQRLREFFVKQLGGFPEPTPLNVSPAQVASAFWN